MKYSKIVVAPGSKDLHGSLRVALAHLTVSLSDIEASYLGKPNTSPERLKKLSQLLNDVVRHGVRHPTQRIQLLILPEVSVPHSFASFITQWSRAHQIGVICGLEHWIDSEKMAWNQILATLPYVATGGVHSCVPIRRLKRHYSPNETFQLQNNYLHVPKNATKSQYQLIQWRGATFAIYNCYELASIEDRGIFKSKVDFAICSEFNPDVKYFSSIVEAAARDLHCYVLQVNSAQFGDSRIVSPSRTEKLTPVHLKGGDNQTFITMELPLQKLRLHQRKDYGLQKDSADFKPTPPGFSLDDVLARIELGD